MMQPIRVLRVAAAGIILLVAGCSTAASTVTGPVEGAFRLVSARVTPGEIEMLEITAELTNTGTVPLRSGGCLRPDLAIDFAAPGGWTALDVLQTGELVLCIQAFALGPGASQQFTTAFRRKQGFDIFPRGVPLRLRVLPIPTGDGPTLPFTIQ